MAYDKKISVWMDNKTVGRLELIAGAKGVTQADIIRELINTQGSDFMSELFNIKIAVNIIAAETAETRKHVSKISEILTGKLNAMDTDNTKHLKEIADFLVEFKRAMTTNPK